MQCNDEIKNRMKRVHGQMNGILNMMEAKESCQDLIIQLKAIRENIDKTMSLLTTLNLQQVMNTSTDQKALQEALDLIVKSR
jgi:DNA-binding FrmR family transcriptional regulator